MYYNIIVKEILCDHQYYTRRHNIHKKKKKKSTKKSLSLSSETLLSSPTYSSQFELGGGKKAIHHRDRWGGTEKWF